MKKSLCMLILIVSVTVSATGCFWHKKRTYTFDQKFDYHISKVMKSIGKVVPDEGRLEKIETKIRSRKPELQALYKNYKELRNELLKLIIEGKNKGEVQKKLGETGSMKIDTLNKIIDILFEAKAELTEAEWSKVADKFKHDCSHWWK